MSLDENIEKEIQEKGLTAPRITPERISELMDTVVFHVHTVPNTTTTVAVAVLPVGDDFFTLATEYSACASPENFNEEVGRKIATANARRTAENLLWVVEGYALKQSLTVEQEKVKPLTFQDRVRLNVKK